MTKLFKLIELTRSQPQYGYALAGIRKQDLSDLAQHHYLVAFIAWQLARQANRAGAKLNMEKVLEFALVHDLGELLGGDIGMPYAKANRRAYRLAKAFELENQRYLAKFFGDDAKHFREIAKEILEPKSDEAKIAKLADYIECIHYKLYMQKLSAGDVKMVGQKMKKISTKIKNKAVKNELTFFVEAWVKELTVSKNEEFFEGAK